MASTAPQLYSITSVTDPLVLYHSNGSYCSLPLSYIFDQDRRPITAAEIQTSSLIELHYTNEATYGVLLNGKKREEISKLGLPSLQQSFVSCSKLSKGSVSVSVLLAFLEQAVLREDYKALDSLLKWSLGQQMKYYAETLRTNFTIETFDWAMNTMQSHGSAEVIAQELIDLQGTFYKAKTGLLPYSQANDRQIDDQTWLFHALASVFDVIIDFITSNGQEVWHRYYYPNTTSILCPVISLYNDMWLQAKTVVFCSKQLKDFALSANTYAEVREVYEMRREVKKSVNIPAMLAFRPMANAIEARFTDCLQKVESRKQELDGVLGIMYELATAQPSIMSLIDTRVTCVTKGCGKVSTHYFECEYGVCQECLHSMLQRRIVHCEHCGKVIQRFNSVWKMFPSLSPQEKAAALASNDKLQCSKCGVSQKTGVLPIPEKLKPRVYQLECWDALCSRCLEACVRDGSGTCPTCHLYVDIHEEEVLKTTVLCKGCKAWKPLIREFPAVSCIDHRLCIQCVSKLKVLNACGDCKREYTQEEQGILANFSALTCLKCKDPVRRAQLVLNENPLCACIFCSKCYSLAQRNSMDLMTCPGCKQHQYGQEILLRSYINVVNSVQNADFPEFTEYREDAEHRTENYPICKICMEPMPAQLSKVCVGRCLHCFHDSCLGEAIENDIKQIISRDLRRAVKCSLTTCKEEVSNIYFSGPRALISPELYEKFNEYAARMTHKEFKCGNCKERDYIEIEHVHFPCRKCNFDQCITCHGPWAADHDAKACQFTQIEQTIKDSFPASPAECQACNGTGLDPVQEKDQKPEPCSTCTFSQCPGCKLPYLKDKHCDHVICMNPECKAVFCFPCACFRLPTTEHDNHWHRPQCPHYPTGTNPARVIRGEKFKEKCSECKKLGKMCVPPANLARIRRFALAEY